MPLSKSLLTADEFFWLPENDVRYELILGEVREYPLLGGQHSIVTGTIGAELSLWKKQGSGGCVGISSGFVLARNPDTVRCPDVYYVRSERIPAGGIPRGFWQIAPDSAVEVVSPSESAEEVRGKVRDYLQAGTPLMWVVYPHSQEVVVHTPDGHAQTFGAEDTLEGFVALPGFACKVASLFE